MAWDSTRPVPWRRMVNEWLIYVAVMFVIILIAFRDQSVIGLVAGLLVSGPLYLGFGFLLAKLGYRRKSFGELRRQRIEAEADAGDDVAPARRAKPAPTSRTGGGSGRPGGSRKRR